MANAWTSDGQRLGLGRAGIRLKVPKRGSTPDWSVDRTNPQVDPRCRLMPSEISAMVS